MCLLQIVSQEPRALETVRLRMSGESASQAATNQTQTSAVPQKESEQPRKRSRKLEKAKRWRGTRPHTDPSEAFAWNQKVRRRLATDSSHDDGENGEADVLEVEGLDVLAVEHLSKRLEALVDILCLRQVAAGVGSEISDLLSDLTAETIGDDASRLGTVTKREALFGSSVRKLMQDDDLDDAQWLCSAVVEPHFEASLPRQCSLFRSKCFVSLQSRTPARPTKIARIGSMGSPPMRTKRSAAALLGGSVQSTAGGGLSDVLEKEQAGRRVKRNILAERSSMLGRGREVDMGRRLARSVSANFGPSQEQPAASGVFSRSSTNASFTQPKMETVMRPLGARSSFPFDQTNGRLASQQLEKVGTVRSSSVSSRPSLNASSSSAQTTNGSKRLLVLSTPQKEPSSKMIDARHFSQIEKPRLVYPSLVMESPTQEGAQLTGQRGRLAERCASFGGRSSFQLKRSASPVAFHSDVEED